MLQQLQQISPIPAASLAALETSMASWLGVVKGKKSRPLRSDFLIFVLRKSFFLFFLRKFHLTSALIITLYHQTNIPIFTLLPPPIWIYSHSDFFLSFFLGGKTKNTFRPLLIPMSNLYHQTNIPIFALLPPPIWIYSHSDFFQSFFLGGTTKNTFRPLLIPMSNQVKW